MDKMQYKKPNWDEYFLGIMDAVALRGSCNRGRAGCVITRDNHILATGYVGSPPGEPECDEVGHDFIKIIREPKGLEYLPQSVDYNPNYNPNTEMIESQHCVRTIHAEQNAIVFAARHGISLEGGILYVSMTPCIVCARMLVSVGIMRIVARNLYRPGAESINLFKKHGIVVDILNNEYQKYDDEK